MPVYTIKSIPRIEGHLGVEIEVDEEKRICKRALVRVFEGSRCFEALMLNRRYDEIPYIASRICGVCGYAHTVCAAKALIDIVKNNSEISEDHLWNLYNYWELALLLNAMDSHLLHTIVLMHLDYGLYSKESLLDKLLKFRYSIGKLLTLIYGDRVHPRNIWLDRIILENMKMNKLEIVNYLDTIDRYRKYIVEALYYISKYVSEKLSFLTLPNTVFVALKPSDPRHYYIDGIIAVNNSVKIDYRDYRKYFIEKSRRESTSKETLLYGSEAFIVGALSRLNTSYELLSNDAKSIASDIGFKMPNTNPIYMPIAQLIEVYNGSIELQSLVSEVMHLSSLDKGFEPRGQGIGVIEAPRGLLYYNISIGAKGLIDYIDIVTPTAHNLADMEERVRAIVNNMLNNGLKDIDMVKKTVEFLVRSYDPCVSCAVHVIVK